jgi:MFS family permease
MKAVDDRGTVLAIMLTSYLMIVLDISIVITGLPNIRATLDFTPVGLSWVQSAYLLCFGGFLLLAAKAGDIPGRKRLFMAGLMLFTSASLAVGLANAQADFATEIALPMILIGAGNGGVLGPLTVAGVAGVEPRDHSAASGLVNAAHQLGGSLGLGILVVVFAAGAVPGLAGVELLDHQINAAIQGGSLMLGLGLLISVGLVMPSERARLRAQTEG